MRFEQRFFGLELGNLRFLLARFRRALRLRRSVASALCVRAQVPSLCPPAPRSAFPGRVMLPCMHAFHIQNPPHF